MRSPIVAICRGSGRLGNHLLIYAHFVASAARRGYRVIYPMFAQYGWAFEGTAGNPAGWYPPPASRSTRPWLFFTRAFLVRRAVRYATALARLLEWLGVRRWRLRHLDIRDRDRKSDYGLGGAEFDSILAGARLVLARGWRFRDPEALREHQQDVRAFFRPVPQLMEPIAAHVAALRRDCDVVAGLHIRQGDYRRFAGGAHFLSTAEYAACARRLAALLPGRRVRFLICTDEAQDLALFDGVTASVHGGDALQDCLALSLADYLIGPRSTFGDWASFYGRVPRVEVSRDRQTFALADFRVALVG